MAPDIVSIVIVPNEQSFGSLYEIKAESNEIFISSATVENVEIIDAITAGRLRATGNVVTASQETINTGVQVLHSAPSNRCYDNYSQAVVPSSSPK